jgi:O-antigen ligase
MMASLLIVLTHFSPTFRKPVLVTCLLICMLGVSFCVLFLGIGGGALSAIGRDASLTGRTDVWKTVLPYAVNQWVGSGYENFWIGERIQLFNRLLGGLNQAHNGYIEVYLNIGWAGIVFLVAVIIRGYRNTMKSLRRNPEAGRLKLAFFLICLVYNFTEASFKMMSPVWLMFLWAIMAAPQTDVPEAATVRKVGAGTEALSAWRSHEPSNLSAFPFEICGLAL